MKIALVVKAFVPEGGGSERYVWNLARGLVEAGHGLTVYAAEWPSPSPPGMAFRRVRRYSRPSFLAVRSFCRNATRILSQERHLYQVVAGFGKTLEQDVYRAGGGCHRAWLEQKWGARWEAWARWHPLHREILRIEDRLYGDSEGCRIICNSQLVERELARFYPATAGRTRVVYNGVDLEAFHPGLRAGARARLRSELGLSEVHRALLFVGHDYYRKGLDLALASWGRISPSARERMRLLVVGKAGQGLRGRREGVLVLGSSRAMPELYAAADLLLFPTRYDAFSNVVLEALASGLPVITTDANGAAEVVETGRNGWVVPLATAGRGLLEVLEALPNLDLAAMGQVARGTAEAFPLARNLRETLEVYRECAREPQISA